MMEKLTFEQSIERLEKIVAELESGNCTLERSFELFEEGTALTKSCNEALEKARLKISELTGKEEE